ncbi:MAG: right-handed parallel beta-helix repeat-containing protein [Desulfuromonadaceae bacterium]|nr:right-handed parallel beta-helix repeat-containing protein [Desulfuromonadaceae bacterium]
MFRLLAILLFIISLAGCTPHSRSFADAPDMQTLPRYSGTLTGITEWRDELLIAGDVRIPVGSQLIIHPGTRIYIRAAQGTKIDPEFLSSATELLIQGELRISGSTAQPVVFTPLEVPDGTAYGWAGIELLGATRSQIVGTELRNAETGILCVSSSPLIKDNHLSGCRYGIIAQLGSAPVIRDNLIESGEGGIFCWRSSAPVLVGNRITGQQEEGIHIDADSMPTLHANTISHNDIGIYLGSRNVSYPHIQFNANRVDVHLSRALTDAVTGDQ